MSDTVIKVENLSKLYRLGVVGTGTLSHDLNRWWHKIRGKEDPYSLVGEANKQDSKGDSEYVWALKDINFEVKQGEVLGIIGKNGAGKSTLLKILSKVTGPTTGTIKAKGRIASLLEVGTGFHPELTGRENIYLNGTILGMTKAEVKKKLDEIVEFAGVARYVDTPVKRYSSGMKVRLGFAVAAHLEPEILIVDEVLAVGDAEFQKKAIGKMQEVSHEGGRTVLFVSHNMGSVQRLCDQAILLADGSIAETGSTTDVISKYLEVGRGVNKVMDLPTKESSISLRKIEVLRSGNEFNSKIEVDFEVRSSETFNSVSIGVGINNKLGYRLLTTEQKIEISHIGITKFRIEFTDNYLPPGWYGVSIGIDCFGKGIFFRDNLLSIDIPVLGFSSTYLANKSDKIGVFMPSKVTAYE